MYAVIGPDLERSVILQAWSGSRTVVPVNLPGSEHGASFYTFLENTDGYPKNGLHKGIHLITVF